MDRYRDLVEDQIRAAMERGEFDDLAGMGRPLELGDDDAAWWARRKIRQLNAEDRLAELGQEVQREVDALWLLSDERQLRDAVDDLNQRIDALNQGIGSDVTIPQLEPTEAVTTWRAMSRLRRRPSS